MIALLSFLTAFSSNFLYKNSASETFKYINTSGNLLDASSNSFNPVVHSFSSIPSRKKFPLIKSP
jgi:hypothetical protein